MNQQVEDLLDEIDRRVVAGVDPPIPSATLTQIESRVYLQHSLLKMQKRLASIVSGKTPTVTDALSSKVSASVPLQVVLALLQAAGMRATQGGAGALTSTTSSCCMLLLFFLLVLLMGKSIR